MKTYGTAKLFGAMWHIEAEPHVHLRAKRIFGKINRQHRGALLLSHTPENCRDLEWFLERYPLTLEAEHAAALRTSAAGHRETMLRLERIIDPNYTPQDFKLALPPRSYQAREAEILLSNGALLIADDVGLGKTAAAICSLSDGRTLPACVVTLAHLPKQWADEVGKFAPALRVHILKKGTPYELPKFFGSGPDVLILNYHKLTGWSKVLAEYCQSVIFDEIQELRHRDSQKYEAAQEIAGRVTFRLGLSATPIYNYGGEIFNVFDVLKPGAVGTRQEFNLEWCSGTANDEKARLKDPKAFGTWAREQFLMIRHTRRDVGRELPPVIKIPHRIDADTAAIDKIENNAAELARIILNQNEAFRGQKLQASEELSVLLRQATGIAKAPYVADFVRLLVESGEKVVLCGWHRAVYDIWAAKLKDLQPVFYTGEESAHHKELSKGRFVKGDAKVFVMSLRAGAGMNDLQYASSVIVFGELDWSPGVHEQCIGRLARDGQNASVAAYFLVADQGSDPTVSEMLGLKREQVEGIRNPNQDSLEQLQSDDGRTKRLATAYLKQIGRPDVVEELEASA